MINVTWVCGFVLLSLVFACGCTRAENFANQVHLSLGENAGEVVVTWSTPLPPTSSSVRFGLDEGFPEQHHQQTGWSTQFVDNGTLHHTQFVQRAVLSSLKDRQRYAYQVWNDTQWSSTFSFVSPGLTSSWNPRVIVYGDFGLLNPRSFPALMEELAENSSDFIFHSGLEWFPFKPYNASSSLFVQGTLRMTCFVTTRHLVTGGSILWSLYTHPSL